MSRKNLFAAAAIAAFLLVLIPAPSQASSRNLTLFSEPVAGIFAKIERWWHSILSGPERPESSPVREKNGCGIDPSGQMVCDPDPTRRTTKPGG